jgi:hypothetical protein
MSLLPEVPCTTPATVERADEDLDGAFEGTTGGDELPSGAFWTATLAADGGA